MSIGFLRIRRYFKKPKKWLMNIWRRLLMYQIDPKDSVF